MRSKFCQIGCPVEWGALFAVVVASASGFELQIPALTDVPMRSAAGIETHDGRVAQQSGSGGDTTSSATTRVPSWVADAIFYQIFPERFSNGDRGNDPTRESLESPN